MAKDDRNILEVLKFELQFLEKGGYGRSPRSPWKPQLIFEDSPSCMNYDSKDNRGRAPRGKSSVPPHSPERGRRDRGIPLSDWHSGRAGGSPSELAQSHHRTI